MKLNFSQQSSWASLTPPSRCILVRVSQLGFRALESYSGEVWKMKPQVVAYPGVPVWHSIRKILDKIRVNRINQLHFATQTHSLSTRNRGGYLNAHLDYISTCDCQKMEKSVVYLGCVVHKLTDSDDMEGLVSLSGTRNKNLSLRTQRLFRASLKVSQPFSWNPSSIH